MPSPFQNDEVNRFNQGPYDTLCFTFRDEDPADKAFIRSEEYNLDLGLHGFELLKQFDGCKANVCTEGWPDKEKWHSGAYQENRGFILQIVEE